MKLLIIFLLLTNFTVLKAQSPKVDLVLQSGIAFPLFDFSTVDLQRGSFALAGYTGTFELKVILKEKWTGYIQGGLQLNPIDVGWLGYEKVKADPFLEDLYIRSDPFKIIHIVAGPGYQTRIGKSFVLDGQLAAGLFFSSTPYQLYKARYALVGNSTYEITRSTDVSFAYGAGFRISYQVARWYQIGISNQILHSKAAFDFISGLGPRTEIKNLTLLNTSFSMSVKLFPNRD